MTVSAPERVLLEVRLLLDEPGMSLADMIEDGIEDEPHLLRLERASEPGERGIATETPIDFVERLSIVFVIGLGAEDRREIEGVNAECFEVIEVRHDAVERSARVPFPR